MYQNFLAIGNAVSILHSAKNRFSSKFSTLFRFLTFVPSTNIRMTSANRHLMFFHIKHDVKF